MIPYLKRSYVFPCSAPILMGIWFLCLFPQTVKAQVNGPGTTSADFEKISMGARAAGMGDAFAAVANDATAMYWNPAGLVLARGTEFSLTNTQWVEGVTDEYFAFSQNLERDGAFGGALEYLGTGTFSGTLENTDGSYGGIGNNVSASLYMGSAAYAQRLGNWFAGDIFRESIVGVEVSGVGENVSSVGNSGIEFSLAYIFEAIHRELYLTFVTTDLGSDIQSFSQPLNGTLGGSLQLGNLFIKHDQNILALDGQGYIDTGLAFKVGDEYKLNFGPNAIALRAGYRAGANLDTVTNLTMGVGLYHDFNDFEASLDYAYVPYSVLGDTNRVTLNIIIGGKPIPPKVSVSPVSTSAFVLGSSEMKFRIAVKSEEPITNWKINILDSSGSLVRTISGKGTPPSQYAWDGRDQNGELVAQGDYSVNVEVKDDDDLTGQAVPSSVYANWVPKKVPLSYVYGVSGDLLFASGKSELLPGGLSIIRKAAAAIRARFPNSIIQIAGYTDNVKVSPTSKFKNNQELSLARAQSVMAYLIQNGMNPNLLSAIGYGETNPIASNATPEGRAKNRRVELIVSGTIEVTAKEIIQQGLVLLHQKDYKGALTDFLKAIQSDSRNALAYHLAGDCYLILGGKNLAIEAYTQSLKYDPSDQALRNWLQQYAPQALNPPTTGAVIAPK